MHRNTFPSSSALAVLALTTVLFTSACNKELDTPPERTLPTGSVFTVTELRDFHADFGFLPHKFIGDSSVYAVVTADEQNGNLYKNVFVQDDAAGIVMRLKNSGGLYQGDRIRIYLKGTTLSSYNGMLQLDSVDVDENVIKQETLVDVVPQVVTIAQVGPNLQGQLVKLENVQFTASDTGLTYADVIGQTTVNRNLENCGGDVVLVRNSGYANFAGLPIPNGKGSIVAVVGQFGQDMQLFIRDLNEVQLSGPRCGQASCAPALVVNETFSSVVNGADAEVECWLNVFTLGSRKWKGVVNGSELYCEAKPPSFGGINETWLVSAPMQFTAGTALSFLSALGGAWQHDGLSVWVSADINLTDGTAVANAPWVPVTGLTLAGSGSSVGTWTPSGAVALDPFLTPGDNFVVGFKYSGTPSTEATPYRIDDVLIQ